jgi:hypothetical protein
MTKTTDKAMSQPAIKKFSRDRFDDTMILGGLFFALLFFLMSYPLITDRSIGSLVLDIAFSAILIVSAYAVSSQRKVLVLAVILAVPTFGLWWSVRATDTNTLVLASLSTSIVFFVFIIAVILRNIFRSDNVTLGTIFGVMSVYLLIGVAWSFLYAVVEMATPGSFDFGGLLDTVDASSTHGELRFFGYYSLVTLSTLGYGDITPLSPIARSMSALEAITGQLYIAVLIAFMVGTHVAQKGRN